jgi:GntR family transcriptional regulator
MSPLSYKLPLWYQLSQQLRADIIGGKLKPGQKIDAEVPLAKRYGISVVPVRQALRVLEEEGFITRRRGSGTFVSKDILLPDQAVTSLESLYSHEFSKPARILDYAVVPTPERFVAHFPNENQLACVTRLAFRGGVPWSFGTLYFAVTYRDILSQDLLERYPLYRLLEEQCGVILNKSHFEAKAIVADAETANHLAIEPYSACLALASVGFDKEGRAIGAFTMSFLGDPFVFGFETSHQFGVVSL